MTSGISFFLAVALTSFAEAASPAFKLPIALNEGQAGKHYSQSLRALLVDPQIPGPLTWEVTSAPNWISISNETLVGDPRVSDSGVRKFKLSVTSGEGADIGREATLTVFAPPVCPPGDINNPYDLGIQNEGKPYQLDLTTIVSDPSVSPTTPTTFSASGLPASNWLTLNNGFLGGTPQRLDVGPYSEIAVTAIGKGGTCSFYARGTVLRTVHTPKWTINPIPLPDAQEDGEYTQTLVPFVSTGDATAITYDIVTQPPPPWLQLGKTSGALYGNPGIGNVGQLKIAVLLRATIDGAVYTDTTDVTIHVIHTNHPPLWSSDPLNLPEGTAKVLYSQSLGNSASDPDRNDLLTYKIMNGPGWATLEAGTGKFSGTPTNDYLGTNTWVVSVTDPDGLFDTTTVTMKVNHSIDPPYWTLHPTILQPNAVEDSLYQTDLAAYAVEPNLGGHLSFTKLDGPAWIHIDTSGVLTGTPHADEMGLAKFRVKVSDNLSSGSDVSEVQLLVEHQNHPPIWNLNPIFLSTTEDSPFSAILSAYAKDPDTGDTLTFGVMEGPTWAELTPGGKLAGTPHKENVGTSEYRVRVSDNHGATADATVSITIKPINHAPTWNQNGVALSNGKEDQEYAASVRAFVTDPDSDRLTFSMVNGPAWITVGMDGSITGTPRHPNVGMNTFTVRAMDPGNLFADVTVSLTIDKTPHAPRCRQTPIAMPDAIDNTTYSLDLKQYIVDDDGDSLVYSLVSYSGPGQNWVFVGSAGDVKGTPMTSNDGQYSLVFRATDGGLFTDCPANGTVIHRDQAPIVNALPTFDVKVRDIRNIKLNDPQYVSDPQNLALNFELQPKPGQDASWVKLTPAGDLTLRPTNRDLVGQHQFPFKVDNGKQFTNAILTIQVVKNPRPPIWIIDPIAMNATVGQAVQGTLKDKGKDLDGYPVTFSRKPEGSAWLTVASDGTLSGTPATADSGLNTFTVTVCNSEALCSDGTLNITVGSGTVHDEWLAGAPVSGARAENVWVIDHSNVSLSTVKALKRSLKGYFQQLSAAGIHWSSLYISTDAHRFDGAPIEDDTPQKLMSWMLPDAEATLHTLLSNGFSSDSLNNCYSTPIFAMHRLYERAVLPEQSDLYHRGFWMSGVPSDAMVITQQRDHYTTYTKNGSLRDRNAGDFADAFKRFHVNEHQAYRLNVIAPECPELVETTHEPHNVAELESFATLAAKTGGAYIRACNPDMDQVLRDHAGRTIRRAYLHAKRVLMLSKQPQDAGSIRVSVGRVALSSEQWSYDAGTNRVTIRWELIDDSQVKDDDKIVVEY